MERPYTKIFHALAPFIASLGYLVVVLYITEPMFLVNDNVALSSWAREGLIAPVLGIPFTKLVYGLSSVFPYNINWYGVLLYTGHLTALTLLISGFNRLFTERKEFYFITGITYLIFLKFIVYLDYTSTAFMLATASVIWLLVIGLLEKNFSKVKILITALILAAAGMLRYQAPLVVLVLFSPLFLYVWVTIRQPESNRQKIMTLLSAVSLVMVVSLGYFCAIISDQSYKREYSAEDYRDFQNFYNARGRLHAFPVLKKNRGNEKLLSALGWTSGDYRRFEDWIFFDEEIYNINTLSMFQDPTLAIPKDISLLDELLSKKSLDKLYKYRGIYFILFAWGIATFARKKLNKFEGAMLISVLLMSIGIALYSSAALRFPTRIAWPFLSSAMLSMMVFYGAFVMDESKEKTSDTRKRCLLACCALIAFLGLNTQIKLMTNEVKWRKVLKEQYTLQYAVMNKSYEGKLLLV